MFEEILGREYMIKSAKDYGNRIRQNVSRDILRLIYQIDEEIKTLETVKKTQEQWYPHVGITTGELIALVNYFEKLVTIFRVQTIEMKEKVKELPEKKEEETI